MTDEKDTLPSDLEDGGLKPRNDNTPEPTKPLPKEKTADTDGKVEKDPSEQPS